MRLNKLKLTGLVLGLLMMTNIASASLLLEPHLGYNLSGSGTGGGVEYDYNGPQLGLRVGYQQLGFMTGLDYTRSSFDIDHEGNGSKGTYSDVEKNELGLFVGYNLPILIRAWATYYFSNTMKYENGVEESGNTTELGVGFTGLPFLSINFMYRMAKYDEQKIPNGTKSDINDDYNEFVVGVSLPFTL